MKIGVISLPLHTNYGGILQAYALQTVLQEMGHEVVLLDNYPQCPSLRPFPIQQLAYLKRLIRNCILPHKSIPIFIEKNDINNFMKMEHIRQFYRQHILNFPFSNASSLEFAGFDAFVVGSDQVWRPLYNSKIYDAYLAFTENWPQVKRVAYAVSFGSDEWEYTKEQTFECKRLVHKFDAISLREISGVQLCKQYFDISASLVLDPTFLLDIKCYKAHIANSKIEYPPSMCLGYILDDTHEKKDLLKSIATFLDYDLIEFKNVDSINNRIAPTVESWLKALHNASFVFTDSFHGCVFSIIFKRPFIVYGNRERGMARFYSLLRIFGLESRLVTNRDEALKIIKVPIDWESVNNIMNQMKDISLNFLRVNL